ncbi:hypothetical protein [Cysteiniphilum sp. JM-1]|uniref:hypothetical protein n=1 Tax=Cysteiniphilum sp. JM-1 TaxID=2610891 RepID=UPI00124614AA|nr:hypothetical protein [Cysteiniphilum sp. JM-1]
MQYEWSYNIVGFASLSHEVYYPSVIRHGEPLLYGECYPKNPPSDDNFDYPLVTTGSNAADVWGYVIDYTAYNGDKYSYSNVRADGHVNITYDYANTFNPSTQRLRIVDMVTFTDPYLGAKLCSIKDWDGWIQINFNNVPWGSDPTTIDIYSGSCTVSYNYQYTY